MKKTLIAAVLTALTLTLLGTAAPASAYTPPPGAAFNDPDGTRAAQNRLAVRVRESIKSVPRHGVVRIAAYSFDRKDIADALIGACRRGVSVQIVLNDNWTSRPTKRMRRIMGTRINPHWSDACHPRKRPDNPKKSDRKPYPTPSFVKICKASCRGGAGNQHMKFFTFSQAGRASNVLMTGSVNLTEFAASTHWNDMYTLVGKPRMYNSYARVFRELAEDKRVNPRYRMVTNGDYVTEFGARSNTTRATDPILRRLNNIKCNYGRGKHTQMRIEMYAWAGTRGAYLASKVADLDRRGCVVRAILSSSTQKVKRTLRRGGVQVRSASMNLDGDRDTGWGGTPWERFTHEKYMTVNGWWNGGVHKVVWTGSENWSQVSLINDELTLRIPRAGAHADYTRHFNYLWTRRTRP